MCSRLIALKTRHTRAAISIFHTICPLGKTCFRGAPLTLGQTSEELLRSVACSAPLIPSVYEANSRFNSHSIGTAPEILASTMEMLPSKLGFIRWRAITDHSKKVIKFVNVLELCCQYPIPST